MAQVGRFAHNRVVQGWRGVKREWVGEGMKGDKWRRVKVDGGLRKQGVGSVNEFRTWKLFVPYILETLIT